MVGTFAAEYQQAATAATKIPAFSFISTKMVTVCGAIDLLVLRRPEKDTKNTSHNCDGARN
ncbi:hypothetical protein [Arcanobacterium hippocoleae]|uniref:Uncharacterized protein n=2 Tax=Arcanobacterium hippocoleae TaxID=149017 RepID=A0ABU1T0V1_9ACTO|nr:hypothetical protein [Arcanobacterium hippocoleae]MDR6938930.1 hypothetical protein [Arcanobacterium hippocoleae]